MGDRRAGHRENGHNRLFFGRKAQDSHESLWIIAELTFFALFAVLLFMFVRNVEGNTLFEKNYYSRDIALTLDSVQSAPQTAVFFYKSNMTKYSADMSDNKVKIGDRGKGKGTQINYWFYGLAGNEFPTIAIAKPIEDAEFLFFAKAGDVHLVGRYESPLVETVEGDGE